MPSPISTQHVAALVDGQRSQRKCAHCGIVNFGDAERCRRCQRELAETATSASTVPRESSLPRGIARRLLFIFFAIVVSIFAWSRSLLLTSSPIDDEQQQAVMRAVSQIERAGFSKEASVLRHFANYRATDNWWNTYLGHSQAYAATNFPLGVVTLYVPFFDVAVDDTERAAILLHEAEHLLGAGEPAALERTWREKSRLGWTADRYAGTTVWKNTKEWTATHVPSLFRCGETGRHDCIP